MDSFIIIDGVILWVLAIVALLMLICFIAMGNEYTDLLRENDRLRQKLKIKNDEYIDMNRELIKTKAAYYRLTDKSLEVD